MVCCRDVDLEVTHKLTPKELLKYEKSKAALRRKLRALKRQQHGSGTSSPHTAFEGSDVRSAVKASMSNSLTAVPKPTKATPATRPSPAPPRSPHPRSISHSAQNGVEEAGRQHTAHKPKVRLVPQAVRDVGVCGCGSERECEGACDRDIECASV